MVETCPSQAQPQAGLSSDFYQTFRTAVWKVFLEVPRRIPVGDERIDLLVRTIDASGNCPKKQLFLRGYMSGTAY